ncbi:ISL3 family transposase [Georgenia sp. TF02-10]|uniref:ISL3 family transposase n=1 Tax=Georgenia sp. TF02-10 TaxID=2917725 RepID=UPI001FA7A81C|nr:ISL3 family transposase [Georgenia sp. TF02-10]UNX55518.1 ISL3 family transposase [Georgenia sp. TF02-10]
MRNARVWRALIGVEQGVVIERVEGDADGGGGVGEVTVHVRVSRRWRGRCGICRRRAPGYDAGTGRRRWRALDLGTVRTFVEADAPRVTCAEHGVVVAHVPWARHGAGHTLAFDDQIAWLTVRCSKTAVAQLMRIAWRTVGAILTRVAGDALAGVDRSAGLRRIGIDEVSYKKGHRYLTVVVDHDTGRLLWAAPGRDKATLRAFFDALGPDRCAQITHVSADAADWIAAVVAERCPNAVRCADPFHVVAWATDALDEVRRQAWNRARGAVTRRRAGRASGDARALKHARYALWKNPENLTEKQTTKLAWVAKTDPLLYRAYLLKEGLRTVFQLRGQDAKDALDRWISWARRCRIPTFVDLQRHIVKHRDAIDATLDHGLSNGLIESTNTKIRLLTRQAFGFHRPEALVALAMLALGGYCPPLPGRGKPK